MVLLTRLRAELDRQVDIAPLVSFRILFGAAMCYTVVRFMAKGWVNELYIHPLHHFKYFGFYWVDMPAGNGLWWVFAGLTVASACIAFGFLYRLSAIAFFVGFTYVELLDVSTYLNHYYFISIAAMLMCLVPANRAFSVDVLIWPSKAVQRVPLWTIGIIKLQLGMVYFFAGLAKLNADWLFRAQPMATWLPPRATIPVIGWFFKFRLTAQLFSWAGAIFDLSIPFLLNKRKTVLIAYLAVIAFHVLTGLLFPIGVFPVVMVLLTTVFFPAEWHRKSLSYLGMKHISQTEWKPALPAVAAVFLTLHFAVQILLPMRYLVYPGHLFWHEQGFRFSWRVMLMEKEGTALFKVTNPANGKTWEVNNGHYLTPLQEKMMATQPDLILQYAHLLDDEFRNRGIAEPVVTADVRVSLNGRRSRPLVKPDVDLSAINDGFQPYTWLTK